MLAMESVITPEKVIDMVSERAVGVVGVIGMGFVYSLGFSLTKQKELKTKRRVTYQKGACKNCGATTHKERDCVERPRSLKKAAWKSGLDIAPDEVSLYLENHGKISYDAKRDNWGGYDTAVYNSTVVSRFDKLEEELDRIEMDEALV